MFVECRLSAGAILGWKYFGIIRLYTDYRIERLMMMMDNFS